MKNEELKIQEESYSLIQKAHLKAEKSSKWDSSDIPGILFITLVFLLLTYVILGITYEISTEFKFRSSDYFVPIKHNPTLSIIAAIFAILMPWILFKSSKRERTKWNLDESIEKMKKEFELHATNPPAEDSSLDVIKFYVDELRKRNLKIKLLEEAKENV